MILDTVLSSARPRFNDFLRLRESALCISDFEIPYHDADFINKLFQVARLLKIKTCVWVGDALHLEAFSPFPGGDKNAEEEIKEIDNYLPGFLEPFDKVYWLMGNHDERLAARLQSIGVTISTTASLQMTVSADTAMLFKQKVIQTNYRFMEATGHWILEHPKNQSVIPGRTAQGLSAKYHKHVLCAHTHNQAATMFNGFHAIESGHCVDTERLRYVSQVHSTRPQMAKGAVLMILDPEAQEYTPIPLTPQNIQFYLNYLRPLSPIAKNYRRVRKTRTQSKR